MKKRKTTETKTTRQTTKKTTTKRQPVKRAGSLLTARDETLQLLRQGLTPGEIARRRGVSLATTIAYLDGMVGRGAVRRSDILFSVPAEKRQQVLAELKPGRAPTPDEIVARLQCAGMEVDPADVAVVLRYGDAGAALGDIYEDVRTIEVQLHTLVRRGLEKEHGPGEEGWWRQGIPKEIRKKCQERREDDDFGPAPEAYCYTDLIDLREILKAKWETLKAYLPTRTWSDKKGTLDDLIRLNQVRRLVMHPVRGGVPSEADFEFLRALKERLGFAAPAQPGPAEEQAQQAEADRIGRETPTDNIDPRH